MKKVLIITLIIIGLIALGLVGYFLLVKKKIPLKEKPEEEKKYTMEISGAWALFPIMGRWVEEFQKDYPYVTINLESGGAGKGMMDVLTGKTHIGMVSREIFPAEKATGAVGFPVTKDAVVPTINVRNPVLRDILARGLTRQDFIDLWIKGTITDWGELVGKPEVKAKIQLYTRLDPCGAAATWAKYLGEEQVNLRGIAIYSDPGLAREVRQDSLGTGYNNINYAYQPTGEPSPGLAIIPLDLNENGRIDEDENFYTTKAELLEAITFERFPSPPARDLYLVTLGKPKGVVKEFIRWILTEGQAYVKEAGYVPLSEDRINQTLLELESD